MGEYVTNLDDYANEGTYFTALFFNRSEFVYFDKFGFEHAPD